MRHFATLSQLILGLWLGCLLCFGALVAPALFAAYSPDQAAQAVRLILPKLDWVTVGATFGAFALGALATRRLAPLRAALLGAALLLALSSLLVLTPRMTALRAEANDRISELPKDDPRRREFGKLHGISSTLMLAELLLGLGAFFARSGKS